MRSSILAAILLLSGCGTSRERRLAHELNTCLGIVQLCADTLTACSKSLEEANENACRPIEQILND
mgnify:CR=1 FL=1